MLIARLAPQDYHRFHCPAGARVVRRTSVEGSLFTVNPIAIRQPRPCVYTSNKRVVDVLVSPAFGVFALVAVGATAVGSIKMTAPVGVEVDKGAEHGVFAFGGSTVLVLLQEGAASFDADLVANSRAPLETIVRTGERVGVANAPRGLRHTL